MKTNFYLIPILLIFSCTSSQNLIISEWKGYDESLEIANNLDHSNKRMRYKLIQSKVQDKNEIWDAIRPQIVGFSKSEYEKLKPLIYERDIISIQTSIQHGDFTYEKLVQWYLFRIALYESNPTLTLHTIISINPNAIQDAKLLDQRRSSDDHPIYGMPILLKDNINAQGMPTTAGAIALASNETSDAFIVTKLKAKGAIILGKVNLSEWAYFFCSGCPVGYSAIGGQTLNPYGRKQFETGGSSSGSGTSMAANYAIAAIGTETSGSILSPSGQNSIVGLKPTIGLLSRTGIVPISSTLDTPGPMTRNVSDNAILLSALLGKDSNDPYTKISQNEYDYHAQITQARLHDFRLGANSKYMKNDLYRNAVEKIKAAGAVVVIYDPIDVELPGFISILNIDMKNDLPTYLSEHAGNNISIRSVQDVINFNLEDTLIRAPYGQKVLEGIVKDTVDHIQLKEIIIQLKSEGRNYFDSPIHKYQLDAVLSINNYDAGKAAVAHYPCITVPMGYNDKGEPENLTIIAENLEEEKLLKIAFAFEQETIYRKPPAAYIE